ncbi:hypothetical protein [Pedobacter sp. AJM]|uniref:hypothetical protein n=1 Tax=Pedobacter sp. AJM TaxID=2003629 RepID=UPI000B4A5746|nr:hypothetical protein [Pedobacter sp. AJM]OWK68867.1 hypothetical protein CBW18_19850 [Pedobacter sp. AJM]
MKIKILLLAIGTLLSCQVIAQSEPNVADYTKPIEIIPPSPNANSLGKYGGIDLSLATGSVSKSIPLYDCNSSNLKVPISLFYSTNGFKVDEIPGRVGVGWSLNAGGVITRTVFGSIDELSQRVSVPSDFPARTDALISFMEGLYVSNETGQTDAEPDLFSFNFNGYVGRFILDNNLNPIQLSHSNLKIERDFSSADWNFKITDGEGIQYFFGGADASEQTKKTVTGSACGKTISKFAKTAWYLKKIIHPKGDLITFSYSYLGMTYSIGIQQSIYKRASNLARLQCSMQDPVLNNTNCQTILQTDGVLLQEINCSNGISVNFSYIDRNDGNDKLINSIEVRDINTQRVFKSFLLNYTNSLATGFKNTYSLGDSKLNYKPFLVNLSERDENNLTSKTHFFSYNDIGALPPRLSYAQDHFGFFNGKNNSTLIPAPTTLSWKDKLLGATADRAMDPEFSKKGLLSLIKYPTGGKDSIIYEGNMVYGEETIYPQQSTISATAFNPNLRGTVTTYSTVINIAFSQEVSFNVACVSSSTTGGDPLHDVSQITLIDQSNSNAIVYNKTLKPGEYFNEVLNLDAGHSYIIKCSASGEKVSGSATIYYMNGNITTQKKNIYTGGVRVAKVISSDPITNISITKKYFYSQLNSPEISSGYSTNYTPLYEKFLTVYIPCSAAIDASKVNEWDFYSMYSNTVNNIYVNQSSPLTYKSVIESLGENFENGGIEHQYTAVPDLPAYQLVGKDKIFNGQVTSYLWRNAREFYQQIFKKQGNNSIPVKKVFTHFKEDERINAEFKAYIVNKKYNLTLRNNPPTALEVDAYDLFTYSNFIKWVYIDSIKTQTFDATGNNYVENIVVNEYANPEHAQLTKTISNTSDLQSESSVYYYPQDVNLSGDEESARLQLIDKHILSPVLKTKAYKNSNLFQSVSISYHTFPNGLTLPRNYSLSVYSNPEEPRVQFDNYDKTGNLLQQSVVNGAKTSYLWSYNGQHPIAEIRNADYATVEAILGSTTVADIAAANPTDSEITSWINQLRNSTSLKDAHITSYTYKPLVGMTSMTDPKGMTTYYEYDEFQRLKNMKDQNGNILKNTTYHYKN